MAAEYQCGQSIYCKSQCVVRYDIAALKRCWQSDENRHRFVAKYGKNLGKAYLKKIQELAPFVEAWDETLDELDIEYKTVQDNLRERVDVIEGEWTEELSQKIEKQPQTQLAQLPDEYEGKD